MTTAMMTIVTVPAAMTIIAMIAIISMIAVTPAIVTRTIIMAIVIMTAITRTIVYGTTTIVHGTSVMLDMALIGMIRSVPEYNLVMASPVTGIMTAVIGGSEIRIAVIDHYFIGLVKIYVTI